MKSVLSFLKKPSRCSVCTNRNIRQRAEKRIHRDAHTAYKVHREDNGEWLLCYTAVVRLYSKDIDNDFFGEDGRTGYTRATIWGDGKIHFQEEIVELDEDDYIFPQRPYDYPFPYRADSPRQRNNVLQHPADPQRPADHPQELGPDEIIHADYWPEMNIEMV